MKTITAGDYTIEFDIEPEFFEEWLDKEGEAYLERVHRETGKTYNARADAFRDWITEEMERKLSLLPDLGFEEEPIEQIKIAVTTFAYNNGDVIHLLRERGNCIKSEDWKSMQKVDKKINDIKNSQLEDFTTPCSIFMSFELEEGVNRALQMDNMCRNDPQLAHLTTWLDKFEIQIQKASEPTDIIWENR